MSRATSIAAFLGLGLALPGGAWAFGATDTSAATAPAPPPPAAASSPGDPEEVTGAPFSVEEVDHWNRSLVVRNRAGLRTTVRVAPTVEGFDALAKGDRIALDYYRSSVVSLGRAKEAVVDVEQAPTRANAPVLGAAGGRQITSEGRVTGVDAEEGMLEMTAADGRPHALSVRDPAARMRLGSLTAGDQVTVTYTEAVAVEVHAERDY